MKQLAAKIISLPAERTKRAFGTDDLNICEFPLTTASRTAQKGNVLVFEDDVTDDGLNQKVHRKVIVSSSEAVGLPTPADSDVLLVLMELTNRCNQFSSPTVHFSRYELVKALGWDQSGKSYRRIDEALQRWVHVTLQYNKAWWIGDENRWQTKSFHILEAIDLRGRGEASDDGLSSFTWNQVILESFKANRKKPLDLDAYFHLRSPAAKQAYRFLEKHFHKRKVLEYDLRTFACEKIGLSKKHDIGQLKRNLQPALKQLEDIGFLKPMTADERYSKLHRDEWTIRLIRQDDGASEAIVPAPQVCESAEGELLRYGMKAAAAKAVVREYSSEYIRSKISLLEWLLEKGGERAPRNKAGYLMAAIRNNYQPPSDYRVEVSSVVQARPVKSVRDEPAVAAKPDAEKMRLDAARTFYQSLTAFEQKQIEDLAVKKGNSFSVDTYRRVQKLGGRLCEEMLTLLIADLIAVNPSVLNDLRSVAAN